MSPVQKIPHFGPVAGVIRIPGSKSISNRVLLIAALARGKSHLLGLLRSDDVLRMREVLEQLGCTFFSFNRFQGCNGRFQPCGEELYIENAGTAARFLTAALCLGEGRYVLSGNERMQKRPIQDLVEALRQIGVSVAAPTGCPPVELNAKGFPGGKVVIPGDKSSQYISALMMVAPYAEQDTLIQIQGELVSSTYVEMTQRVMADFGVEAHWLKDRQEIHIPNQQRYNRRDYWIEGDASSASYFFALAAIAGGEISVQGIEKASTQGDLGLLGLLEEMGCVVQWKQEGLVEAWETEKKEWMEPAVVISRSLNAPLKAVWVDMNSMSDVAPTLAVVALFAEGETRITNVANMRIKECDRLFALYRELKRLGAEVYPMRGKQVLRDQGLNELNKGEELADQPDGLAIVGDPTAKRYHGAELDTYDDHRMAMCLSLAGTRILGVHIKDPGCVSKTFPTYWEEFLSFAKPL